MAFEVLGKGWSVAEVGVVVVVYLLGKEERWKKEGCVCLTCSLTKGAGSLIRLLSNVSNRFGSWAWIGLRELGGLGEI